MLQRIFDNFLDNGLVLPIPNPWLKTLKLRLFRFDLDPRDSRIGLTIQVEW